MDRFRSSRSLPRAFSPETASGECRSRRALLAALGLACVLPVSGRAMTPEATGVTGVTGSDCLLGEWIVVEIGAFIERSFRGMAGVRRIEFLSAEGDFRFVFDPGGRVTITATRYVVTVAAHVLIVGKVETAVIFDGVIAARYAVAGDRLVLTDSDNRGFSIRARTPFGSVDAGRDGFFGDGESRIVCGPAELLVRPGTDDGTPLILLVRPGPATPAASA